jgi:hypothetical protein
MPGRHRDLCWACNHGPRCMNRGTADKPVFYCEEFDTYVPVSRVSFEKASRITSDGKGGSDKYKGLCLNCEDRETCTIRDLEGGVWHCEEYR